MTRLFGIPVGTLALVLAALLAVVLAAIGAVALRNRVFLRLGVRSARRRRGRTALIVTGLALGTAIITAALATGDTMSQTIRTSALAALGPTDEVVAAKGVKPRSRNGAGATGARYFPARMQPARADLAVRGASAVDPVIVEHVAVQNPSSRQTEPRVTLFAAAPGSIRAR